MPVNDWIAAGRAGAQGLSDAHGVIRDNSPKYGETYRTNMNARASERIAQLRAREKVLSAGIKANIIEKKSENAAKAVDRDTDRKVSGFRKAGILGALGGAAGGALGGYFNSQYEKREAERDALRDAKDEQRWNTLIEAMKYTPGTAPVPKPLPTVDGLKLETPVPLPPRKPGNNNSTEATAENGGTVSLKGIRNDVYDYLTTHHQLSRNHALGLMANIDRESGFDPYILSGDDGGPGGLFQWKGSRQTPAVASLVKAGDWRGQIDYALSEPENLSAVAPGLYGSTNFNTPLDAADWWMRYFERPADTYSGSKKHVDYLSTYTSF